MKFLQIHAEFGTKKKNFDKDVYREDTGSLIDTYETFYKNWRNYKMKKIELHITLQGQVLDTQGQALNRAVHDLGYEQVNDIRVGKSDLHDC